MRTGSVMDGAAKSACRLCRQFCARAVQLEGCRTVGGRGLLYGISLPSLMDRISPSRASADSSADGLLAGTAASGCAGSFAEKTLKELPDGCSGEKLRKTKAVGANAPHYRPSRTDGFNSGRSGASLRESPSRTPRGRRRLPRGARRSDRSVCARRVSGSCRRCGRRRTKDGR